MNINGISYRAIWPEQDGSSVNIIDQTRLPHDFSVIQLTDLSSAAQAISTMQVRGAPLIGATAAFGVALAMQENASDFGLKAACDVLLATRPTAVNLRWALERMQSVLSAASDIDRVKIAWQEAKLIADEDVEINRSIGVNGLPIIRALWEKKRNPVNILTHCNAGWLATVDWGTALAPIYAAHDAGIPVHVWVDETRPRNQGASLTAWELQQHGVQHTLIVDNVGGHLMQHGQVDMVIVGTDRTTAQGDVCNKIGTYLKALAANDNNVPFYVALPAPTIDWRIQNGVTEIPIEQRDGAEVSHISGLDATGKVVVVNIAPVDCQVANYAFDVTPARLVTGLITERGVCAASKDGLLGLYPEQMA
ncbi:S-methyl-5-thioribose-1-phosphate isomerase [Sulfurirhabdus autotrophica]|uniref:Methylthioribose-1-phosphate isomerase n=1 Tax=Sulfurirhabdus autotrophica TaxID=1706046 RepID=A0A4R3Y8Y2_9PROT|nr:S-methyl-5-thioribose-1-phosphate isomerase [Sulfurirhabdus autotrophica]TCV87418.1 methylthioribose-1-phosphate isomerase [Sulfurirhabdus autotrophica]